MTLISLLSVTAADLQQEMINMLKVEFPEWTDLQYSNNMIAFLEVVAAVGELNYSYLNTMARECFLSTAVDPRNVEAHAKALGYNPLYQTPAEVQAVLTLDAPVTAATPIPAGTKFATVLPSVYYETVAPVVVPLGQSQTSAVTLKQWESWTTPFTGTATANQQVSLDHAPVIPSTVVVVVNGETWTLVDSFVKSTAVDKHFMVFTNVEGYATVLFGDGVLGKMPPMSSTGSITYKSGGGISNTISAGQLQQAVTEVKDAGNNRVMGVTAYNAGDAAPGTDRETIEQIRINTILNLRSPTALLTKTDVRDAVLGTPGVQACRVVNWEDNSQLPNYMMQIYVKPVQNTAVPGPLRTTLDTMLTTTRPLVIGQTATIMDPTYKSIDFDISVIVELGYGVTEVRNAVYTLLSDLFDPAKTNVWNFTPNFGMTIYMGKLAAALQSVPGVQELVINSPGNVVCSYSEFPILGAVALR